jgi:hypothetical protein
VWLKAAAKGKLQSPTLLVPVAPWYFHRLAVHSCNTITKQPYNEIKLAKKTSTTHNKAQLWLCTVVFWQQWCFLQVQYVYKIKIHLPNFYTEMQD